MMRVMLYQAAQSMLRVENLEKVLERLATSEKTTIVIARDHDGEVYGGGRAPYAHRLADQRRWHQHVVGRANAVEAIMLPVALVHSRDTAEPRDIKTATEGAAAQISSPDTAFQVLDRAAEMFCSVSSASSVPRM